MSTDIDLVVADVVTTQDNTECITPAEIELSVSSVEPCALNSEELISYTKSEYSIVGDALYATVDATEAPTWLVNIVDTVVANGLASGLADMDYLRTSITTALSEIELAKNAYTESIISIQDIDALIVAALVTLNATVDDNSADLVTLQSTKVDSTQATTIVADYLASSLAGGTVNAALVSLQSTLTTDILANATSIYALTVSITDPLTGLTASATAVDSLQAYVGIDGAGAFTGTGLSAYMNDAAGNVGGAESEVANSVYTDGATVKSKWEYDSTLVKNGEYYNAGFGLNLLGTGTGTELDPFDSEFWINAEKFSFTNNAQSGQAAPFTIDASGATPILEYQGILTGDKLVVNTLTADRLISSTGNSTVWSGGGLVSADFNGNPYGNIGTPTTGFRLSSDAIGSATDPSIYGAYIKGGTLDGSILTGAILSISDFRVKTETYPENSGRFQLSYENVFKGAAIAYTDTYLGQNASSGHSLLRMCLNTQIFKVYATCDAFFSTNTTTVQVSVNGGAWTTIATDTGDQGSGVAVNYSHSNTGTQSIRFRCITSSGDDISHAVNRFHVTSDNFI